MREFLVTKFVCSNCGGNLQLSSEKPASSKYADGEPTGAAMVESLVVIVPCKCVTRQIDEMRNAAKVLLGQ